MLTDTPLAMLKPVLNALADQLALLDEHGHIVFVNRAWTESQTTGMLTAAAAGEDFLTFCELQAAQSIRDVLSGESAGYAYDYPHVSADGLSWHSLVVTPVDGERIRGALVAHSDITHQMKAELARRDSDLALESLIDASPLAIIVINLDCQVTHWNRAAERMFGWTEAEVLGRFNPIIPLDKLDQFRANIEASRQTNDGIVDLQVRGQRKDGSLIDVRVSHAAIRDVNEEMRAAVALIADVTAERRKAEQQAFLSEAAEVLAASLDYERALAEVTRLAVPRMADICSVNLIEEDGTIRRLAGTHYDPAKQPLVDQVVKELTISPEVSWGTARVVRTHQPEIMNWPDEPGPDESEQLRQLREIGLRSTMTVPLTTRDGVIGTITFVYGDSGRDYSAADLEVAEHLANRAAAAIDNARLYQEALKSETRYRAIVEHVPAITYMAQVDDVTNMLNISNQSNLPLRIVTQELAPDGKGWTSYLHPDDVERVQSVMDVCSATGAPLEIEYRIVYEDGELVWRLDRAQLIYDAAGKPMHWQGLVVDITERKRAEDALNTRALQQAAVALLGQRSVGDVDLERMVADAANVVYETLGTEFVRLALVDDDSNDLVVRATAGPPTSTVVGSVVELDSDSLMAYTHKTNAPVTFDSLETETRFRPWPGMVENRVRSGLSVAIPGRYRPAGVIIAVTVHQREFTSDDINFLQAIANMVSATVEHARDEGQLSFQADLLNVISQAVIATDIDGQITSWNRHAEDLYGWTADEVIGMPVVEVTAAGPAIGEAGNLLASVGDGQSWSGDIRLRRKDGSTFPGWVMLSPILDGQGDVAGVVGVSADISERIQAHAERERLVQSLGERVKELTVLHRAAALFETEGHDLDFILSELASMIPTGMQSPGFASVKLEVGDRQSVSSGYRETPWAIRSEFVAPDGGNGQIIVCYVDPQPHSGDTHFSPEEISLVESLADMLRAYLERMHSRDQVIRSQTRFRTAVEGTLDAFAIFDPVRDERGQVVDYRFTEINARTEVLLRRTRDELIGQTIHELFLKVQADLFVEVFNHVIQTGETIEREVEVPRESGSFWVLFHAVPLEDGIAAFASETTERRRLEDELIHQAFHDTLTGLPNRALFLDRVEHARTRVRRRQEGIAVLFIDLDNFKIINDSLGHGAGDLLLVAVAERLTGCIGRGDTVARFGGDEFAVLLEDLADWGSVSEMAESIIEAFKEPFVVLDRELFITPSIGAAVATEHSVTANDLLRDADAAMYRAKRKGKARVEVFDPSLTDDVVGRFELENDLRRAIDRDEFVVHYQPIIRMPTGETACMEALVRWQHPIYGLLAPAQFIPIAEETGMIVQIGSMVLEAACREAVAWNVGREPDKLVKVSVNISPRQFRDPGLVESVESVLTGSGLVPGLLFLDLTESLIVEDEERVKETLQRLKRHGVRLAVDDFGIGYSSLGALRSFPVNVVKIDRTFVSGIESNRQDAVMLAGIIDLAHALNLRVVAEGVETAGERDQLRAMGCDLAQGYLFARPLPASEIPMMV